MICLYISNNSLSNKISVTVTCYCLVTINLIDTCFFFLFMQLAMLLLQRGMPEQLELQQLVETGNGRLEDVERADESSTIIKTPRCRPCPYLGLLLATLSSLFFSLCSVIVKWLVDVHPMELAACRFVGVLLPAVPIVLWRKEKPFPKGKRIMLLLRSFVGTTGLMLSFYAFRHMPLADASVIIYYYNISILMEKEKNLS